jgi:hypothetical protein
MSNDDFRKYSRIRSAIKEMKRIDLLWGKNPAGRDDQKFLPWMPFSWPEFISMTAEALPELSGRKYLEVGCGPGSRMLLAREIFGLEVSGFDRVSEYTEFAGELLQTPVTCEDALEYKDYGSFDLLWFNRPIRDQDLQGKLEAKVWDEMAPGAVVACAHLDSRPPQHWYPVLDDWEIKRGVWQKP